MRRWKPQPSLGRWVAVALLLICAGAASIPAARLAAIFRGPPQSWPIDMGLFWWTLLLLALLFAAAALLYRAAAAFTLGYELDRNGLYISWLGSRAVVPLERITSVDIGVDRYVAPWGPLQSIGYHWGQARISGDRTLHLFSTRPPERSLLIHTPEGSYAISPADHESFVQDLEQRRNLGATKPLSAAIEPGRIFLYAFWNDRTVRLLTLAAVAINLVALAVLCARYPGLPETLQMRFDAMGQAADVRPRPQVLFIPLAAFGLTLVNLVLGLVLYNRQQLSARLLQGASVTVQILFAVALLTITG